jgi:hypothetical protein
MGGSQPPCLRRPALDPKLTSVIIRHFKLAAPIIDALNTPIAAALVPKKKVLFGLH